MSDAGWLLALQKGGAVRAVLGIDAAWTITGPSGVALAIETANGWRLVAAEASYDHFLERARGAAPGDERPRGACPDAGALVGAARLLCGRALACVAVDMPLGPDPIVGRRRCDNLVSSLYGARKAAAHSPSAAQPGPISDALRADFAAFDLEVCTAPPADGLIEVYPHAALIAFMGAPERLPVQGRQDANLLADAVARGPAAKAAGGLVANRRGAGPPDRRRRGGACRSGARGARLAAEGVRGQARRGRLRRGRDRRAGRPGCRLRRRRRRDLACVWSRG